MGAVVLFNKGKEKVRSENAALLRERELTKPVGEKG